MVKYNLKGNHTRNGGEKVRLNRIKLATELLKQDMTQVQLSKKSGVARTTISGIKSGRSCREETARAIAAALNVAIEELM